MTAMKLEHNPFGMLRAKSRSLRRKSDRTRIQSSSAVSCDLVSPKLAHFRLSQEDLPHTATSSVDSFGHHHHADFSTNSPILLGDDKELHDPNFVRHNWEMMSGESTLPDNQLHIGRASSPRLHSRRSTMSSRTGSSRPSSRSGSDAGGHHPPSFGLGFNAFSGLSSYSPAPSSGRNSSAKRSNSTKGLQVEGSILRDEEAILDSDSSDEEDDEDDHVYRLPTSRRTSPLSLAPTSPRTVFSNPPSPTEQQATAFHRRRHWTVAEGAQASNGAGIHAFPGQQHMQATSKVNGRSFSQPA